MAPSTFRRVRSRASLRAALAAVAALALGVAGSVDAAPPSEAEVFARLGRIESMEASFVQSKTMRIFSQPQRSEGRLTFDRAGALVWEYTAPQRTSLRVAGGRMTMTYPDLQRSEEIDLASNPGLRGIIESMFLWLKADPQALRKGYEVEYAAAPVPRLRLVPRAEGMRRYIASLSFTFGDDRLVRRLVILEPDGDSTDIEFTTRNVVDRPGS